MSKVNQSIDLFDYVLERHCLASLVHHNYGWPELQVYIKDSDFFHPAHRTIFNTIVGLISTKSETNEILITGKLKSLGIDKFEDLKMEDYVGSICRIPISKDAWRDFFKGLVEYRVKREISEVGKELQRIAQNTQGIEDLIAAADAAYSKKSKNIISLEREEFVDISSTLEDAIEHNGNNPTDWTKMLYGPFDSINKLFGSLHRPGNITMFGARSGCGKTNLSLFYNIWMAEKYNMPILWLDHGEMSAEELQLRIAAVFSGGRVPLFAIEHGDWRKNPDWVKAIRESMPRAKKIKIHYFSISGMSPNQVISSVRRYKYNKVGRDNRFLWVFDYLKPFDEDDSKGVQEWKQMGHFLNDVKAFIKDEIDNSFFTSVQLNRSGITNNRHSKDVDDSENSVSISDRLSHYTSHLFLMRRKTADEIQLEGNRFGNLKLTNVKKRHLGKEAERAEMMVKMPDGKYKSNYINLDFKNFIFTDKGDLNDILPALNDIYNLTEENSGDKEKGGEMVL